MVDGGLPQDEAEDGATPILLSYYRRTGSYPWQQPMPDVPLLRTLCHDYANAFWRKQKRRDRLLERWMTLSSDGYRSVEAAAIDGLCAKEFLDSLPPRLRELVRHRLQGDTCAQIAERLGVSTGTVQAYLRDLRQLFKKFFGYDPTKRGSRDSNSYGKIEGREDMNDEDSQNDMGGGAVEIISKYMLLLCQRLVCSLILLLIIGNAALAQDTVYPSLKRAVMSGNGHVACSDNSGIALPEAQWEVVNGGLAIYPTAAVRSSSITVDLSFALAHYAPPYNGTLSVLFVWYDGRPVSYSPASQQLSVTPGTSSIVRVAIGPLPNQVYPRSTLLIVYRLSNPAQPGDYFQSGFAIPVYLVYERPNFPQLRPRIGVLDNACTWAKGENTYEGVARKLTTGLFFAQRFAYPTGTPGYPSSWTDDDGNFRLSDFLATPGWVDGNCVDVSDYLLICANALGLNFTVAQYTDATSGQFITNPLCPIGSDPTRDWTYQTFQWIMHQFCFSADAYVYDACAAQMYDLSGNAYRNPPFRWPLNGLWQTMPDLGLVVYPSPSIPYLLYGPYVPLVK